MAKLTRNQKFALKQQRLSNKSSKIRNEAKLKTAAQVAKNIGRSVTDTASVIAANRTSQAIAKYDADKAKYKARYNDNALSIYNGVISGNPADGESGSTQTGSTSTMPGLNSGISKR